MPYCAARYCPRACPLPPHCVSAVFWGARLGNVACFPDDVIAKCAATQIQHRSDHSVTTRDAASGLPTAGSTPVGQRVDSAD